MNDSLGDMSPTMSFHDRVHNTISSGSAATLSTEQMSSRNDANQEPAGEPGSAMPNQMEASVNGGIKGASTVESSHDGHFLRKRPNATGTSNSRKKPKTVPSTNESPGGAFIVENTRRTRRREYKSVSSGTKKHATKARDLSATTLLSSTNDTQVDTDAAVEVGAQSRALELPRLKDQTEGESENLEIQPESQPTNETLQEISGNKVEAITDVQRNGTAKVFNGQQHAEPVPLVETATQDVRTESVEPDHEILASSTPPMGLSTAPNYESNSGISAVGIPVNSILGSGSNREIQPNQSIDSNQRPSTHDKVERVEIRESPNLTSLHAHPVLFVKTHMQPSQTAQLTEDRAGSETTKVATPASQEPGSSVNPITIPNDPLINDNNRVCLLLSRTWRIPETTKINKDRCDGI